jgi:hypothetical protein
MLDETMILETPPLYHCYGRRGQQVEVPVTGSHAKRVLHGAINVRSGDVAFLITDVWDQATHAHSALRADSSTVTPCSGTGSWGS